MTTYVDMSTGHQVIARPRVALRWFELPYGIWTCTSGREVLFNRDYSPIWSQEAPVGREWVRAKRTEKVAFATELFFYGDADKGDAAKEAKAISALLERGLPIPDRSLLVNHDKLVKESLRAEEKKLRQERKEAQQVKLR